jgi:hypothetical protein
MYAFSLLENYCRIGSNGEVETARHTARKGGLAMTGGE